MTESQGRFVWYELMTTDTAAAKAFYGTVVGWDAQDAPMPGTTYTLFTAGGVPVAGLMTLPEAACNAGAPPGWTGYVAVGDVDATAAQAQRLGGVMHVPPTDIPEVGRFAVLADPQGAAFALFRWAAADRMQDQAPPDPRAPGRVGWHELAATDREAAFAFYAALFGWRKAEAFEMGEPVGLYQLVAAGGGQVIGGMFTRPPGMPGPSWLYYLTVGDIGAAAARVQEGGGRILHGPVEVPGGDWILHGVDPQGAAFALVGRRG